LPFDPTANNKKKRKHSWLAQTGPVFPVVLSLIVLPNFFTLFVLAWPSHQENSLKPSLAQCMALQPYRLLYSPLTLSEPAKMGLLLHGPASRAFLPITCLPDSLFCLRLGIFRAVYWHTIHAISFSPALSHCHPVFSLNLAAASGPDEPTQQHFPFSLSPSLHSSFWAGLVASCGGP